MSEDRPQYQRDTVPTNAEIAERLRALADDLVFLGELMEYAGGFGSIGTNGTRLLYVAHGMRRWAHEIGEAQG